MTCHVYSDRYPAVALLQMTTVFHAVISTGLYSGPSTTSPADQISRWASSIHPRPVERNLSLTWSEIPLLLVRTPKHLLFSRPLLTQVPTKSASTREVVHMRQKRWSATLRQAEAGAWQQRAARTLDCLSFLPHGPPALCRGLRWDHAWAQTHSPLPSPGVSWN